MDTYRRKLDRIFRVAAEKSRNLSLPVSFLGVPSTWWLGKHIECYVDGTLRGHLLADAASWPTCSPRVVFARRVDIGLLAQPVQPIDEPSNSTVDAYRRSDGGLEFHSVDDLREVDCPLIEAVSIPLPWFLVFAEKAASSQSLLNVLGSLEEALGVSQCLEEN